MEPNGANWYAVIDPGEFNASLVAYNYKKHTQIFELALSRSTHCPARPDQEIHSRFASRCRLFHWTRRVQEAAMLFHRERAEGDPL